MSLPNNGSQPKSYELPLHGLSCNGLCVSVDGRSLVTVGEDGVEHCKSIVRSVQKAFREHILLDFRRLVSCSAVAWGLSNGSKRQDGVIFILGVQGLASHDEYSACNSCCCATMFGCHDQSPLPASVLLPSDCP